MRPRTYIAVIALLSLIGLCIVYEVMQQTKARYQLGAMVQVEEQAIQELVALRAELAELKRAARLERVNKEKSMGYIPLIPLPEVELTEEETVLRSVE